jgi:predicted ATPase
MLTKIDIPEESRERVSGKAKLVLKPGVNLLVGPNGSGKSTVLRALADQRWKVQCTGPTATSYYDTEKMNPRVASYIEGVITITSRFKSHGQVLGPVMTKGLVLARKEALRAQPDGDWLGLIDEPEAGLDHSSLLAFRKGLRTKNPRIQYLIATHHPLLWVLKGAHVIELVDGYVAQVLETWRKVLHAS